MRIGQTIGPFEKWWLSPAGWPLTAAAAFNSLMIILATSVPGTYFELYMISLPVWILIGAVWAVRLLVALVIAWRRRHPVFRCWSTWRRWAVAPVIVMITILLLVTGAPLRLSFWASRTSMDHLALRVLESPSSAPTEEWIGVYHAERIQAIPGGMRFLVRGAGFIDPEGFAYSPNGPPAVLGEDYYTHWSGNWYVWRESY
jgi:hypothetical protein